MSLTVLFISFSLWADESVPLRGFADVSLAYDKTTEKSNFQLGGVDFFLTNSLSKNTGYLVELVFESDEKGELRTDLERVFITYTVDPLFKISAGRFHTALGYWNETYHHGGYLHTSVNRPVLMHFEDDNGLLPIHTVGLELGGNAVVGSGSLGYKIDVGNGRGIQIDPPQSTKDADKSKSVSLLLFYEMTNGLRYGVSAYKDRMPGGTVTSQAADPSDMNRVVETSTTVDSADEFILGAHLVYNSSEIEFLSEYFNISHKYNNVAKTAVSINAMYAQLGVHFNLFTPYYRYEVNDTDKPDTYTSLNSKRVIHTAGLRYELGSTSALKLEVEDTSYNSINNAIGKLNWSYNW